MLIKEGRYPALVELAGINRKQNVILTAIQHLRDEEEIQSFFNQFEAVVEEIHSGSDGKKAARENVAYLLYNYSYNEKLMRLWLDSLPQIAHLFFGRRTDVSLNEAFRVGFEFANKLAEEKKDDSNGSDRGPAEDPK